MSAGRIRSLAAVTASMAITAMIFGFCYPMFSTRLGMMGYSNSMIGLNALAQAAGVFLVIWFAPKLITRQGPARVMLVMIALKLGAVLLCAVYQDFWPWFLARLVIGAAGSVLWIAGETWINEIAAEKSRGRELAIYGAALGVGTVIGNKIIELTGFEGWLPFAVLMVIVAASALPLFLVVRQSPRLDIADHHVGLRSFLVSFRYAPFTMLLSAVFAVGFCRSSRLHDPLRSRNRRFA